MNGAQDRRDAALKRLRRANRGVLVASLVAAAVVVELAQRTSAGSAKATQAVSTQVGTGTARRAAVRPSGGRRRAHTKTGPSAHRAGHQRTHTAKVPTSPVTRTATTPATATPTTASLAPTTSSAPPVATSGAS
jgi:hypothetical protein